MTNWLRYLAALASAKKYAASREESLVFAVSIASSRLDIGITNNKGSLIFSDKIRLSLKTHISMVSLLSSTTWTVLTSIGGAVHFLLHQKPRLWHPLTVTASESPLVLGF